VARDWATAAWSPALRVIGTMRRCPRSGTDSAPHAIWNLTPTRGTSVTFSPETIAAKSSDVHTVAYRVIENFGLGHTDPPPRKHSCVSSCGGT
jgi:hypothetical protein